MARVLKAKYALVQEEVPDDKIMYQVAVNLVEITSFSQEIWFISQNRSIAV